MKTEGIEELEKLCAAITADMFTDCGKADLCDAIRHKFGAQIANAWFTAKSVIDNHKEQA